MNGIHPRDLWKALIWLVLHLLILTPLFLVYWLIGDTEIFERSWLWSLAGIATLLILAQKKGHLPLVLGLCCLTFWIKVEPYFGLYLFLASAVLFAVLHLKFRHHRKLFWILLACFVVLIPKCLPLLFASKPTFWLWLRESLLLGFFLRYLRYEREFHEGTLKDQRFFEHLGYILFLPQLLQLLNLSPSDQFNQSLAHPRNLWPAGKIFLLGSAKLLAYHLQLLIPVGLQEEGAGSFISAWYQIFTHYLLWFLWLSAHLDYAVALARLFGVAVPAQFHFPLLATSPRDFWQRWHVLHHRFLKEWIYQPCGGPERPLRAVFCTFLVSSLLFSSLWIGSSSWLLSSGFLTRWLPFFMIQALLVFLQHRLVRSSETKSLFRKSGGWLYTQTSFAFCCLFLAGSNRFPCDTVSAQTTLTVLRRAFFLE